MAKKFKISYMKSHCDWQPDIVHADGIIQPMDMSLCGCDLMGDERLGWLPAVETKDKINCEHCIKIINHCKQYKL